MIKNIIKRNEYRDSVFLMSISEKIQEIEGVRNIVIVMATDNNKAFLRDVGLLTLEAQQARPNDIIVAIEAEDMKVIEAALDDISNLMSQKLRRETRDITYPSFDTALNALPGANLALISVPGEFAAIEAKKAIMNGLHVFIFSDNVPLSEEVELKKLAQQNEVLVMGPSCGASVINNVSIGLMSKVRTGQIGIVGGSGSGIQEIAVLVDRQGFGISHAIGTGSRDLSEEVGAITTIQGIEVLEWDDNTEVIVLVSKPPPVNTMNKVLKVVAMCKKKVVINFLGCDQKVIEKAGAIPASTLEEAALIAVSLVNKENSYRNIVEATKRKLIELADIEKEHFAPRQRYLRGLFCGGMHCEEAILILKDYVEEVYSNVYPSFCTQQSDGVLTMKNYLTDLGAEEFTRGRPHPVIAPEILKLKLAEEGSDAAVAVILLDIILGYGAHHDPAGVLSETIRFLKEKAEKEGRYLNIIASICGTDKDPQNIFVQEKKLKEVGVTILPSNAQAALLGGLLISQIGERK